MKAQPTAAPSCIRSTTTQKGRRPRGAAAIATTARDERWIGVLQDDVSESLLHPAAEARIRADLKGLVEAPGAKIKVSISQRASSRARVTARAYIQKLGAISKMGERTLRRLLIIGSSAVVHQASWR